MSLFNMPGSGSPLPDGHEIPQDGLTLLLSDQPILYYEPLSNIFQALRRENYMSGIPNLADGELILDAYDLQLVIPEVCFSSIL